ncbi:predicted protein [Naegleria gruberi]|uniref:Predicted protein n=1 Tax=Naegleria gruberi TaxID=5762 RepID=D2VQR7_NAEGR|nr:uncharacterized protein NAEGRDRAFT_71322 [Naegleria gruberi]EFC40692.1 predicted protein [Naegleria gruberi]|eukprot:XP_002673436.1 predicted protein [Naegleria gruberi strain NEG-M]
MSGEQNKANDEVENTTTTIITSSSSSDHNKQQQQQYEEITCIDKIIETFQDKCKQFKQHVLNLNIAKQSSEETKSIFMEGYHKLLELQSLQIQINIFQKRMNDLRIERKKEMELPLLECNNLSCEASYFQRDISICKNYYSRHVEIDLPSEDDEFKNRDKSSTILLEIEKLKQSSLNGIDSELLLKKQHELMMKRLTFELDEREKLEKEILEIKQEQEKAKQEQVNIEKYINNIPKNLAAMKKTIQQFEPVINPSKHQHTDWFTNEELELMNQLPTPLFILYNKLMEYKKVYDDSILISIVGDSERAKTIWNDSDLDESSFNTVNSNGNNNSSGGSGTGNSGTSNSGSGAGAGITPSYIDELTGEPKRKKLKQVDNNSEMCSMFPLVIQLRVQLKFFEKNKKLLIEFGYLHKANMVVVNEARTAALVLPTLIQGDDGSISPNVQCMSDYDFSTFERGRPYRWLQQICGLEFISARISSNISSKENRPEESKNYSLSYILNLFKYKQKAKRYLLNQLKSLELNEPLKNEFPSCLSFVPKLESFKQTNVTYTSITFLITVRIDKYLFESELLVNVVDYPLKSPQFKKLTQIQPTIEQTIPEEYQDLICHDNSIEIVREDSSWSNPLLYQIEKDINVKFSSFC